MIGHVHTTITPLFFLFFFVFSVTSQLPSSQITAMNNLRQLLGSNYNSPWNSLQNSTNPCSWTGVFCSPNNSSITKLSLSSFSLSNAHDSWPSLICEIDSLQSIDISNNHLALIPQLLISNCTGLKVLNISWNKLSGALPSFQAFRSLEVLDLSFNSLNGSVDLQFDGLNELKSLNLSGNGFIGSVPVKLGNSMLLQELQLSRNSFQRMIPDEIASYRNLTLLDLSANRLIGPIPERIGELSNLQLLLLSVNQLFDQIPQSISGITSLKRFAANQNTFTGAVPEGITRYLENLDLSYNHLNGSIPRGFFSQPNLLTVDLSFNSLEGSIPLNVSSTVVRLRLGSNRLSGQIPRWTFGNVVPSLTYLEADNNSLSGIIPSELQLCKNLTLLDLSHNNLVSSIPPELGSLGSLQVLKLQHNNLSGKIPDQITQLGSLEKLNISWNSLTGSIPSSISRLQSLSNLDLQVNNLVGIIPNSIGSMDLLLELQLGKNQLGGAVESLPSKLQIALNLSHNNFAGTIPSVLSRLQALEILDLSDNRFSGSIPSFLGAMPALTQLILSNNQLSGTLPQFGPHVNVSFGGNGVFINTTSNSNPTKEKKAVSVVIIVAAVAAIFVFTMFVLVALIVFRRIHKVKDFQQNSSQLQIIKSSFLTGNVIHRSTLDFTTAIEAVVYLSNVVLKTGFSTYYKAIMPSGMAYFVKKLNWSDKIFQLGSHDLFEKEIEALGKLRNSSVMTPLAYALTSDCVYLFYEFTDKGTLYDALHGGSGNALDWTNRYSIAISVAHGLSFLHASPTGPIILLDLSSKIIMLKSLNEPQIGDAELAKVIDPSKSTGNLSTVAGSAGYIPPEYAYTMRVTLAGNVYSFGVILLELLTGRAAVSEGSQLAKWVMIKSKQENKLDQILDPNLRGTSSVIRHQMLAVLRVALTCISASPEARPKMNTVLRMILNAKLSR